MSEKDKDLYGKLITQWFQDRHDSPQEFIDMLTTFYFPDNKITYGSGSFYYIVMACGKIGFGSFREAQTAINRSKKRHFTKKGEEIRRGRKKEKRPERSYKCPDCGLWHITSKKHNFKKKHYLV